jgi:hypothetical protein
MHNWQMNLKAIPPLTLARALLFFGLPLLLMTGIFWGLIPLLDLMAVRLFNAWVISLGIPMLILTLLSVRYYRKEGNPWTLHHFLERFRLRPLNGADWLWTFLLAALLLAFRNALAFTHTLISEKVPEPKFFVRMMEDDPNYFMEMPLQGNWLLLFATLLLIGLAVVVQECWLRGYILPRQELVHKRWTWIMHGLLWTTWYLVLPWQLLRQLPAALAISYVAQSRQNTWPGIIAHLVMYVPVLARLFLRVIEN